MAPSSWGSHSSLGASAVHFPFLSHFEQFGPSAPFPCGFPRALMTSHHPLFPASQAPKGTGEHTKLVSNFASAKTFLGEQYKPIKIGCSIPLIPQNKQIRKEIKPSPQKCGINILTPLPPPLLSWWKSLPESWQRRHTYPVWSSANNPDINKRKETRRLSSSSWFHILYNEGPQRLFKRMQNSIFSWVLGVLFLTQLLKIVAISTSPRPQSEHTQTPSRISPIFDFT